MYSQCREAYASHTAICIRSNLSLQIGKYNVQAAVNIRRDQVQQGPAWHQVRLLALLLKQVRAEDSVNLFVVYSLINPLQPQYHQRLAHMDRLYKDSARSSIQSQHRRKVGQGGLHRVGPARNWRVLWF